MFISYSRPAEKEKREKKRKESRKADMHIDDDDDFIYPDPSLIDMYAITTIYI